MKFSSNSFQATFCLTGVEGEQPCKTTSYQTTYHKVTSVFTLTLYNFHNGVCLFAKSVSELQMHSRVNVWTLLPCSYYVCILSVISTGLYETLMKLQIGIGPPKACRGYGETHLARVCEHCEWLKLRDGLGNCGVLGLGGFRILPPQIPIVRPPHPAPRVLLEFT